MAGQKKKHADLVLLDQVGSDRVEEMLERGMALSAICIELKISKKALNEWLEAAPRAALLTRARARAADQLAAETLTIADEAEPDQVQKAKLRTDVRRWLAGKWDPAKYGENKGVQVQLNIGDMHLTALKSARADTIDVVSNESTNER